jgi:putative transcriptional regulator
MKNLLLKRGYLLVSEPSIICDTSFNRSVILIADHNKEGSVGFILNKPLKFSLKQLVSDVNKDFKVFNGGPVEQDNLYFIHKRPDIIPNSVEIASGIYWGGDYNTVIKLINSDMLDENDIKFFLGYTGWSEQQLKNEVEDHSWVVSENTFENKVISYNLENYWRTKMIELGDQYSIWSNAPENPSSN